MTPASNTPREPRLSDFIDMEAYDVVSGEHHRALEKLLQRWIMLDLSRGPLDEGRRLLLLQLEDDSASALSGLSE